MTIINQEIQELHPKLYKLAQTVDPFIKFELQSDNFLFHALAKVFPFVGHSSTTLGNTILLPNDIFDNKKIVQTELIAHELEHVRHRLETGMVKWYFQYTFPQILSPLSLLTALCFWKAGFLAFAACLLTLIPWPAPWRRDAELRAYKVSLAIVYWGTGGTWQTAIADTFVKWLVSDPYYFCSWSTTKVQQIILGYKRDIIYGTMEKDPYYKQLKDIIEQED